jgi:hypothetical protein
MLSSCMPSALRLLELSEYELPLSVKVLSLMPVPPLLRRLPPVPAA